MTKHKISGKDERTETMSSDAQLVSCSLEKGDAEAFCELVGRYTGLVKGIISAIVRDRRDVEDLAQEAFIKAYHSLDKLKERNRFSAWLSVIASN